MVDLELADGRGGQKPHERILRNLEVLWNLVDVSPGEF
jgi:hypothetical protein